MSASDFSKPVPTSDAAEEFELDGLQPIPEPDFELESPPAPETTSEPVQESLLLPEGDPEHPEATPQIEFEGMPKPVYAIALDDGRTAQFQHANSLLESLESQGVEVHYQCREGYCGSCRTQLLEGQVHYTEEPMAWINDDEILPCCCIPKSALKIKLPS